MRKMLSSSYGKMLMGVFLEIEPPIKALLESDLGSHSGGEEPEAEGEMAELESLHTALAESK